MSLKMFDLAGAEERHRFSPYCWRVRLACAHKGLPLETTAWRFTEKDKLPAPNEGTVPVLVDGNRVVSDSWKIAEYLDARDTAGPLFEGPQAKSQALLIKYWTERTLHPLISRLETGDPVWVWREKMLGLYDGLGLQAPRNAALV